MDNLKYENESEKCHGLAGMVYSLMANEAGEMLASVNLDGEESMVLSPEFYFNGNPVLSAKIAWRQMLTRFKVMSEMMVSNVMCRNYVLHHRGLTQSLVDSMRDHIREEGTANYQLEADECDRLMSAAVESYDRLYRSAQVHRLVGAFVEKLVRQRSLSALEAFELLGE